MSASRLEDFMAWLEALSAAVDLSPSLEERSLPRYQTIPRPRRRGAAQVVREQERIIRRQFPHLAAGGAASGSSSGQSSNDTPTAQESSSSSESSSPLGGMDEIPRISLQESITEQDLRDLRLELARTPTPPSNASSGLANNPHANHNNSSPFIAPATNCFSDNGKWCPPRTLTAEANLRYARRCMAVLCGDAPRQSDYIVVDGKRYQLLYESKAMVLDEVSSGIRTRTLEEQVKTAIRGIETMMAQSSVDMKGKAVEGGVNFPPLPEYAELFSGENEGGDEIGIAMDEGISASMTGVAA